MLILLLACRDASPPERLRDADADSDPDSDGVPDTDTPIGSTGDTADTDVPNTSYPPVDPPPVDCATLVVSGGPMSVLSAGDPRPFDTRADGLSWFADEAIYEGSDPQGAVLVYDRGGDLVREDPYGNLYWTAPPAIWRVPAGGVPAVHATGLAEFPRVAFDLELHPHGSLVLAELDVVTGRGFVTWVDPAGAITTTETTALPAPLEVRDVAWAHDWQTLWVAVEHGLYSVPVDGDGAPDFTSPTLVEPLPVGIEYVDDITVDACGGVYLLSKRPFYPGRLLRYDPVTATFTDLGGEADHGYGRSPLRFGRAPGTETILGTLSGGWSFLRHEWLLWDVGVGAPAWP